MSKVILNDIAIVDNSLITDINTNNAAIEEGFDNTISRDGTAPNTMEADLDMNSNRILNLNDPANAQEAATKSYVDATVPGSGAGIVTLTGTQTLTNKTLISPAGIEKSDVGLSNVDNTSDTTKNAAAVTLTNKTIDLTNNTLVATSFQLKTALTDETGSGSAVFATTPTLVTPVLGAATATTINGISITASTGTLTMNTNTLTIGGVGTSYVIAGTSGTLTFQGTDTYVGRATTDTLTNKTLVTPTITTNMIVPLVIGSSSGTTGTQLTLQTTTGNGTTDAFAFKGGNNGATTFATLALAGLIMPSLTSNGVVQCTTNQSTAYYQVTGSGATALIGLIGTTGIFQINQANAIIELQSNTGTLSTSVRGGGFLGTSPTVGIGYRTGAGGTVTQATSKATGVTLNTAVGTITLVNSALAADTTVSFVFTNSAIAAGDLLVLNHTSVGTFGAYVLNAHGSGAGSITVDVHNCTPGSLSEAIVLTFAVIKGVTA